MNIVVIIPAFNVKKQIEKVVRNIPDFVSNVIIVDDKCPQESGKYIESMQIDRVAVLYHVENQGVGGAMLTGYKKAMELKADIVVKVDGDDQMDTKYMQKLIQPIKENEADYTKGNRFKDFKSLKAMPKVRLFGNSALSFLIKFSSGYWNIMDPTNGYTAISKKALEGLDFDKIAKRYFFESDMLINLNIENIVVKDVSIPARYNDEDSSLNIKKVLYQFPPKIFKGLCKRLFYKYFIYDFNMASIYMLLGVPLTLFGTFFGIFKWIESARLGIETSVGTVMLAVLPIILGVQFLLQAVSIDIDNVPKR